MTRCPTSAASTPAGDLVHTASGVAPIRPSPAEVGTLLQVRKSQVTAALFWLRKHNPLYKDIEINQDEIQGWQYAEDSTVPAVLMERMRREEPSVVEKTYTDPIVPNTDRGLEENGFTDIEELLASVRADPSDDTSPSDDNASEEQSHPLAEDFRAPGLGPRSRGRGDDVVYETSTSGMVPFWRGRPLFLRSKGCPS
ncbi:uncharacterized protein B0I36DRAFT_356377 [Microdochium trichocladiopsis]|uniref:DUF6570 domain-containing protein n=1 Tax=Microdochium trichocladiopsis TaxID=1682393 RepID=A0A9P8XU09_9PEZI|nr:uncharacterized protein B0I36DRAFT_356377 [Microdochium trichocladiopsis]KAH7012314.1 hypothetical protein B0I36DRAFT_356377 [Microdochium trichocladiopsis]